MKLRSVRRGLAGLAAAAIMCAFAAGTVRAQADEARDFPNQPIRFVVPFSAGGGNDLFARIVGQKLSDIVKQSVLIDNKPGGNGIIAAEFVAKAKPDGYTLLVGPSGPMVDNQAVYSSLPYDTKRDFAPITQIAEFPLILVVNSELPIRSIKELVDYAKAHPDRANYSSPAVSYQLINELFKLRTGAPMVHVAYKGGGESFVALLRKEVLYNINNAATLLPYIQNGQVRPLAVAGVQRWPALPDVPTFEEAGVKDATFRIWSGLFAPKATPPAILAKLTAASIEAIKSPEVSERLRKSLVEPSGISPEEFTRIIDEDLRQSIDTARSANLKIR